MTRYIIIALAVALAVVALDDLSQREMVCLERAATCDWCDTATMWFGQLVKCRHK